MEKPVTLRQRLAALFSRWAARLTAVTPVDVGRAGDGLLSLDAAGPADRPWAELSAQFTDALEAWRANPLARRIVTLISSFTVGDGITLTADYNPLRRYLIDWWTHPQNLLDLRLIPWCEELSRSGELFVVLHFNPVDGISYVRLVPAACIDAITWAPGDYEHELTYHEAVGMEDPDYDRGGRTWYAPDPKAERYYDAAQPIMLHFAVNRPAGCVRGDSDLAPVLNWLRRYATWLEGRVELNEAMRTFLWIVKTSTGNIEKRAAQLRSKPRPGTIQVVDSAEDWQAVAPQLHAQDAEKDGRAIRWMIAAGGPGLSLTDFGEAETANLATATAMAEQRNRFMKARQAYFGYVLARMGLESYNRAVHLGRVKGREQPISAITITYSDVSTADNANLAQASSQIADAMQKLQELLTIAQDGGGGVELARRATRLILSFAGEQPTDADLDALVAEAAAAQPTRAAADPTQEKNP